MTHSIDDPQERFLLDGENSRHQLVIGQRQLYLDDRAVAIESVTQERITFTGHATTITCTPEALWCAIAGEAAAPTPSEAGCLMAESLARWSQLQQVSSLLRQWTCKDATPPYLPVPRLDSFTEAALARCDGSEEAVQAIAYLLSQPKEQVVRWLMQRGRPVVVAVETPLVNSTQQTTQNTPAHSDPATASPHHLKQRHKAATFHWTPEMEQRLSTAFLASSEQGTTTATVNALQATCGWPLEKMLYKVYQLGLPQKRKEQQRQREAVSRQPRQEDD